MRKIDKSDAKIKSTKYKTWLRNIEAKDQKHTPTYRYYYDDVVMNLYKCQGGICAYTESFICVNDLTNDENWIKGRFRIPENANYERIDHLGELEHFNPSLKKEKYWLWSNLFMVSAKINSLKTDTPIVPYLKPDLGSYSPEKYFDYDETTHRFIPNTDIKDSKTIDEIQHMIDNVLFMNHGVIRKEREDFINSIRQKKSNIKAIMLLIGFILQLVGALAYKNKLKAIHNLPSPPRIPPFESGSDCNKNL
jgi:hypothetical protein